MATDLDLPFISDTGCGYLHLLIFLCLCSLSLPLSSSVRTPKLNIAFYLFCNLKVSIKKVEVEGVKVVHLGWCRVQLFLLRSHEASNFTS